MDTNYRQIWLSKALKWMLRHAAGSNRVVDGRAGSNEVVNCKAGSNEVVNCKAGSEKAEGLNIDDEGYIEINKLITHSTFEQSSVTEQEILSLVKTQSKIRFHIKNIDGVNYIRVYNGETINIPNLPKTEITDASKYPVVIHGTYLDCWNKIVNSGGLLPLKRVYIHLTTDENYVSAKKTVKIYVNLEKCLNYIKFYDLGNGVIYVADKLPYKLNEEYLWTVKYKQRSSDGYVWVDMDGIKFLTGKIRKNV